MYRMGYGGLIAGIIVWAALGSQPSNAQYSANFQTNIISGVTSNWSGTYYVGNATFADVLLIQNSGVLANGNGSVGNSANSSNNSVLVTGIGSVWSNAADLTVGGYGVSNSMTITDGGKVYSSGGFLSSGCGQSGCIDTGYCHVVVSGPGSTWSNSNSLIVGLTGWGNSLVISNGGSVFSSDGIWGGSCIGRNGARSNSVLVTGSASVWSNVTLSVGQGGAWNSLLIGSEGSLVGGSVISTTGSVGGYSNSNTVRITSRGTWKCDSLIVGNLGSSNSLQVGDGFVSATNLVVGAASSTCDNVVEVDAFGNLIVTNATGTGVLEVRHGKLILNEGLVWVDTLVITNPCAQFIDAGGRLLAGKVILDPNTFRIVSVVRQTNDMLVTWMMGPGASNTLQATAGDGSGGYSTNGFTDIFLVTNNTTVGTVTNYLDIGAATNKPARYYRARLVL